MSEADTEQSLRDSGWTDEQVAQLWRHDPTLAVRDAPRTPLIVWVIVVVVLAAVISAEMISERSQEAAAPVETPSDMVACPQCYGSGSVDGPVQRTQVRCYYCDGLRTERCNRCNGTGWKRNRAGHDLRCYKCGGDGWRPCHVCGGKGWYWNETPIQVDCPYCRERGKVTRQQCEYWNTHHGGQ